MKNKIVLLVCIAIVVFGCKKEVKAVEIKNDTIITDVDATLDIHNSQNSLDWQGTYKGTLHCADCEGIETAITLKSDKTFSIATKYLRKGSDKVFEQKGAFTWDKTGSIISLEGLKEKPYLYKVGENSLTQLDMEGKKITGALAKKYILNKQN